MPVIAWGASVMGHTLLIVVGVLGFATFVLAVSAILFDFTDKTGWPIPHPKVDWFALLFGLLATSGFLGLAYVVWTTR